MIKAINKKGSHIGFVVSFVIFVTFLVFLYTIIQPVTVRERSREYILDYLTLNLIGNSTIELNTLIIEVIDPLQANKDCINLQSIGVDVIPLELRDNLVFKNPDGESLEYDIQNINVLHLRTGVGFLGIINVYASEEFTGLINENIGGCDPDPYPIGYLKTYDEIFEVKIVELSEAYYADYEALKITLGIPDGTEFNFYVYDSLRSEPPIISAEMQEPPTDRSVFVQETPIQYISEAGDTLFGFLVVEVW